MRLDLLAGARQPVPSVRLFEPTILLLDSGLGGLTVLAALREARPDARFVYAADDAAFPYGAWPEPALAARVAALATCLVQRHAPDLVVIACNTASTLVLPHLRQRLAVPVVGAVPAVKPAAELSRSRRISILATPGTVARDYTRGLVEAYAGDCRVTLVGARRLAALAEAEMAGSPAPDEDIQAEIAPCFVEDGDGRTDVVTLACTHYPLLARRLRALAPWPVTWIDPAPAIARRVVQLIGSAGPVREAEPSLAVFTSGRGLTPQLRAALPRWGLEDIAVEPL